MERWLVKLIALTLIFICTEICTLLPLKVSVYFVRMGAKGERMISYLMCFGGGVFLGLYMLHMVPDVSDILRVALVEPYGIKYPVTEFITAMGFFLMLFIEKLVMKTQKPRNKKLRAEAELYKAGSITYVSNVEASKKGKKEASSNKMQYVTVFDSDNEAEEQREVKKGPRLDVSFVRGSRLSLAVVTGNGGHGHSHGGNDMAGTRSLLLLLALSLHHVFEGMSVGLKHTGQAVWAMTIAILSHEVVIAFCLGMQLVSAYKSKWKVFIAATMCSAMVPVGMAVGMLIMETGTGEDNQAINLVNGVLQGVSTGVFIYVTFFEILGGEINENDPNMTKVCLIFVGFLLLAALGFVPEGGDETDYGFLNATTVAP